ncbi:carboxypeptidase-like regulatory domain-containing protein [Mucilaginibacter sp.]|uniref:carboxypeptidase-like regulatory domain-containing protein n=1 Tax=Mucilaginibacter sp. TaxID=1882438 RepID=UPI00260CA60C|nr:carboxypeptidase-like regulatory domain-containing protein [Mucilaginibacter sp.]
MKLTVLLCLSICLSATAKVSAQHINLKEVNAPLETVFKDIQKQTSYTFTYTKELLKKAGIVNIEINNVPLNEALRLIFLEQPLTYTIYNDAIVIKDKEIVEIKSDPGTERSVQQSYSITGVISDEKDELLAGATVFLTNTKKATSTDASGRFALNQLQPGVYEVVVKMLGFGVYNESIIIQKKSPELNIVLCPNSIMLKTVKISGISASAKKKYLSMFIDDFIGQSDNAGKCKILNPEVIDFSYNKKDDILTANSEQFIVIENKALGYNVHYLLKAFNMDVPRHLLYYDGSSYLEELHGTPAEQGKWEKNRQIIYEGSEWHFFKAAFDHTLEKEGFEIYRFPIPAKIRMAAGLQNVQRSHPEYFMPFKGMDTLLVNVDENIKRLNLKALKNDSTILYIIYTKKDEPRAYVLGGRHIVDPTMEHAKFKQTSVIRPVLDDILIDKNGSVNPKTSIARAGYWAWNMASGFLPPDYKVLETAKK